MIVVPNLLIAFSKKKFFLLMKSKYSIGSSAIKIGGFDTNARAITTFCFHHLIDLQP